MINRTRRQVENKNEPLSAIIQGVDDAWEVCLLKFTIDLVERSSGGNLGDFQKARFDLAGLHPVILSECEGSLSNGLPRMLVSIELIRDSSLRSE